MIVYLAFFAAVMSAGATSLQSGTELAQFPGADAQSELIDRRFFETRLAQAARADI